MPLSDELKPYFGNLLDRIDVGLLVLDQNYKIHFWNRFMSIHSEKNKSEVSSETLFDHFPEIPKKWFQKKIDSVFLLKCNAFITWEQRHCLFQFKHNRPITGGIEFMAQNITMMPVISDQAVQFVAVTVFDVTDVSVYQNQLMEANLKLETLSQVDGLTNIYNRAHWERLLSCEYQRCIRHSETLSLIMFDVDHFKKVNDTFGHLAGDAVIKDIADRVKHVIRNHDVLGRYGGEEYGLFLPSTPLEGALVVAEKIRKLIAQKPVVFKDLKISFTVSLGVAEMNKQGHYEKMIDLADAALYLSKNKGRNQVSSYLELI